MGLISKTTTLHVHHAFLYISLPSLHGYDVKLPNFVFCGERKQATTKFNFDLLNLNMVPRNSTSGGLAKIWQSKWVGIITIRTERRQIHFLSDVLVAVASLDLKVHIRELKKQRRRGQRKRYLKSGFALLQTPSRLIRQMLAKRSGVEF